VFGLREIHQNHLHVDLVILINERKMTLRFFLYFLLVVGYCSYKYKDRFPKVVWISMTVLGWVSC